MHLLEKATDRDFTRVIRLLAPNDLENLYHALDISPEDIAKAKANGEGTEDKARKVLQLWRRHNGILATLRLLVNAMKDCRFYHELGELQKDGKNEWALTGRFMLESSIYMKTS